MKILITSDWYAPAINGVVTSILNLRKGLEKRGHEVRVLTLSQTRHSCVRDGVTYIGSVSVGFVYPGARLKVALSRKWVRELIEWGPDIVHSNCEFSTFHMARKIADQLNIPLIHTYHTVYEDYAHYILPCKKLGQKAAGIFSRWIAARTDCLIAPTGKVAGLLAGYGIEKPIAVVPTGIEQEQFTESEGSVARAKIRQRFHIAEDQTVLLFVGRLAKEKRCEELLHFISKIRNRNLMLMIVGDGPCRRELEEEAYRLGLNNEVIFTGMVSPKEVSHYYHVGDLFVSASTSEAQGLTYLEALSAGLPMLCRKDACLQGVLRNGRNGWQYASETEFMNRLQQFMQCSKLREDIRCGAGEDRWKFSIAAFAENAERVYCEQQLHKTELCRSEYNYMAGNDNCGGLEPLA